MGYYAVYILIIYNILFRCDGSIYKTGSSCQTLNQAAQFTKIINTLCVYFAGLIYESLYIECLQPVGIQCTTRMSGNMNLTFVLINPTVFQS